MKVWTYRYYPTGRITALDTRHSTSYDTIRMCAVKDLQNPEDRLQLERLIDAKGEITLTGIDRRIEIKQEEIGGYYVECTDQATGSALILWSGDVYRKGKQILGELFAAMYNGTDWGLNLHTYGTQTAWIDFDTMYDSRAIEALSEEEIEELSDELESYSRFSMGGLYIALETAL